MGIIRIVGEDHKDASGNVDLNPPPDNPYTPPAQSKVNPPKAANGNDGGALWWDHDDPGQPGVQGAGGLTGEKGFLGGNGGSAPAGVTVTVAHTISGTFQMEIAGGRAQPGGKGSVGGQGGEGQDGGDGDDE